MSQGTPGADPKRRVKVYHLSPEGQWDDQGTGHVTLTAVEDPKDNSVTHMMVVVGEEDASTLMQEKVYTGDIYQRQQETLIVWTDPETQKDQALSFQDASGCDDLWKEICTIQGRAPDAVRDSEVANSQEGALYEEFAEAGIELPAADMASIPAFCKFMQDVTPFKREKVANAIMHANCIPKLLELFQQCEDLEDTKSLHSLFHIFKGLVLLNDPAVIELVLCDNVIMEVIGALEYDPDLPVHTRHRNYLNSVVIFKEVVPFRNEELLQKIHQTFRITYIKDVVLPRILDDATFATLNSLIYFNNVEIVTQLQQDERFVSDLFARFNETGASAAQRKDVVLFIEDFCSLAKNLDVVLRTKFYNSLSTHGILDIFERTLGEEDFTMRMAATEILGCLVTQDASTLRGYMLKQAPDYKLFARVMERMVHDPDQGIQAQLAEIVRVLVDVETMEGSYMKEEFLNVFYSVFIPKVCEPFNPDARGAADVVPDPLGAVKSHMCSLLAFCVQQHGYRIKYYILGHTVASRVLKLLEHREMYLALAAIRFFRAFVGMKDEFYNRYIIKNNLFEPIVTRFRKNGNRTNLLHSAIVELAEFIIKQNSKGLIQHLAEEHVPKLAGLKYVGVFEKLREKHDQNAELERNGGVLPAEAPKDEPKPQPPASRRGLDDDEEAYFNRDDDDDDDDLPPRSAAPSSPSHASASPRPSSPTPVRTRSNSPPHRGGPGSPPASLLRGSMALRQGSGSPPPRESPPRAGLQIRLGGHHDDAAAGALHSPRKHDGDDGDEPSAKRMRTGEGSYVSTAPVQKDDGDGKLASRDTIDASA